LITFASWEGNGPKLENVMSISQDIVHTVKVRVPQQRDFSRKKMLITAAATVAGLSAVWFGYRWWTVGQFEISTDDAYVEADSTTVAPEVSGYLSSVLVQDNQRVKAGQLLAHIDDRDFRTALDQAQASVAASEANLGQTKATLETQYAVIEGARATVAVDLANKVFAEQDDQRYAQLVAEGAASLQNAQMASSSNAALQATISRDNAALNAAIKHLDQLRAEVDQAEAALLRDQANVRQAQLNLSYTGIAAAVEGVVGNRTLRVGQYVQAGTQLMSIVPLQAAYIVANFKETQLTHIHAGEPAEVSVDTFPGVKAHGYVDSVAPASGQEFALLPPDNATGNFTKIVQRIPVKIILDPYSPLRNELRPGMSVIPTVMTKPVRNG
jgi:membrane fusion protein, multidrug efflux system